MIPPTLADLNARLKHLEHQSATVLFLSAANMFANAVTVIIAVLALVS
jgi:hypothetical protein